ncbi:DUF899 family protein [Nocardia tengchongensis]|uniref:DUF899 family protein n=1 Tax=Nocardia tengchongensis TaxID=2055889 RepID=UPI0033C2D04B
MISFGVIGAWLIGREEVLAQGRSATRPRAPVQTPHARLRVIQLEKGYAFEGPGDASTLLDLFHGLRSLLVSHFLLDPGAADGACASCRAAAEEVSGAIRAETNHESARS